MIKTPTNHGKSWTKTEIKNLENLAQRNTPTRIVALKMGKTPHSIQNIASDKDISLKPTNQSPFNRKK